MAAKKAQAARRVAKELQRQETELNEWLEFCDDTDTSGDTAEKSTYSREGHNADSDLHSIHLQVKCGCWSVGL